ncbi:Na+/H+ antiporter subunit E, partial [Mycobacteroides abscessus]|uniref:Na+/H+ antiporter subunit E n=1 Tax=Mycobacteroides abscessus TaxID=36809 RepID=UPI001F349BBE
DDHPREGAPTFRPPPRASSTGIDHCSLVMALLMNTLTIIPGSVVLEIDQERRLAYVHVLDVGSPKAVASFYAQLRQLERLFISAFERDVDWHPDTNPLRESDTREEV